MRVPAAVVADVEDNRFLVEVVGIERSHEAIEARLVHARNVDVAVLSRSLVGDKLRVELAPALVHEVGDRVAAGCLNLNAAAGLRDRKSTRLNSSHLGISYAVFFLK